MQYRDNRKNGDKISALGFGFMRVGGDEAEVIRYVHAAIERGINYFDTAYIYPGNEVLLGKALAGGYRERVNIATKLPPYLVRKAEDIERMFQTHLTRLQTDHIDYYLIHMLPDVAEWERLGRLGILSWIAQKKESGAIRNIGFSYHGGVPAFEALIDAYDWDFTMIQYNYFDENNQAGRRGLTYAAQKGVPVMIMEPLRGGKLVGALPEAAKAVWRDAPGGRSAAEWGLRWVMNHPEVLCVVSGMNSLEMVEENARMAETALPGALTPEELQLYDQVNDILRAQMAVPCTGCNYCVPCPRGVDIPLCFTCYNDLREAGRMKGLFQYIHRTNGHDASLCVSCGKCSKHCPQAIDIPAALAEVSAKVERWPYRPMRAIVKKVMKLS